MPELTTTATPTSTPSTGASVSTSAPATPAAPAASRSGEGSALASFERVAAAAAQPATPVTPPTAATPTGLGTTPAPTTEGAITPPVATTGTPMTTADGTPEHRIEAAVRNAREELEAQLGWARQYGTREDVDYAMSRWRRLEENPVAFARQLISELRESGAWQDEPQPATPESLDDPPADLRSQDGKEAYSLAALRIYVGNQLKRQRAELMRELQPALDYTTQARSRDQAQADNARVISEARAAMAELKQRPHYEQHKAAIEAEYKAIPAQVKAQIGIPRALQLAYLNAVEKVVIPGLTSRTTSTTVEDLQRAAIAGTTSAPTSSAPTPKPALRDGDVQGLARRMEEMHRAANVGA